MRMQLPLHLTLSAALGIALVGGAPQAAATPVPTTTTLVVTSGSSAVTTVTSETVVTLTATALAGTTPFTIGQVNFCNAAATYCDGINLLATAQLTSAGTATFKFRPGVGSHSYKAVFLGVLNGTTAYASSTSSAAALTVTGPWPSATALSAVCNAPNFIPTGVCSPASYAITGTVGGSASTAPTGTISFLDASNSNAVLGTAPLAAGAGALNFLNSSSTAMGVDSSAVVAGDFNDDGIPDLAVMNFIEQSNGTVTILLGNGDGTFTAVPTSTATGPMPSAIAIGDFNGDGIPDLAVATNGDENNNYAAGVTILLGNGDGTFQAAASQATGTNPVSVVVGDFNGDGNADLAVATSGNGFAPQSGPITVLLGNGDGTFTAAPASPAPQGEPQSAVAGDFNGDGLPDLAVASWNGTLTVLLGNGDGTFAVSATSPIPTGANSDAIAVGDFNGDGNLDLAVANYGSNSVTVLLGNGDGTFTVAPSPATGVDPRAVAIADYNGDGIPDLAVANDSGSVTVLLGNGDGTFAATATSPQPGNAPVSIAAGDFNGDGKEDLAVDTVAFSENRLYYLGTIVALLAETEYSTATVTAVVAPAGSGTHQVVASYPGDSNYAASTSVATALSSAQITPTVIVTLSSGNITTTQALTVTVAVSGGTGNPTPTGSVTLISGNYASGSLTLSNGSAQINIPAGSLATGSDTLTAGYTPDTSSSSVYSNASGTSTVVVTTSTQISPIVTVTPSSSSITSIQALTVAVAVNGPSGSPTPTGSVTLTCGSYTSAATTLSGGSAQINISAGSLAIGTDTLTVTYTPDASSSTVYANASGKSKVAVSSVTPTVTVAPLSTSILTTQALQVNVSVSGPTGDTIPTGSAELTGGGYDSGAITLSGGSVAINIPAGSLSLGSDILSVSYVPDSASIAIYSSATGSSSVTVTAPNPSPVVSSISPAVQNAGSAAFTLTVNGAGFISGSTVYWGTSALTTQFVSAAQVTAQVPASDIADSGTDSITVENPAPGGGTSNTLQFEVDSSGAQSPSFATSSATVPPGESATYSVTLPSAPTAVTASCLNLPTGAACSYSSSANTVTITTSSSTPKGTYQTTVVFSETVAGAASSFIVLPILLLPLLRARRRWSAGNIWFTACFGIVLLVASVSIGCGGGSGGTPPPPPTHQVTTSGVVTLTVQ